jgi:isocitrate lyase
LPLRPPTVDEEAAQFKQRTDEMAIFFALPRFKNIKRTYTPADVVSKQGSLPVVPPQSSLLSDKLFKLLNRAEETGQPLHTMGAVDPVQMTQMAKHQEVVYVSGWACSSLLTTANNEVGPDFGCVLFSAAILTQHIDSFARDYPYTTVPNQVQRLFKAQQLHDKKHYDERLAMTPEQRATTPFVDYLRPIVADADTGHGGLSAVMKLIKLFAESVSFLK